MPDGVSSIQSEIIDDPGSLIHGDTPKSVMSSSSAGHVCLD